MPDRVLVTGGAGFVGSTICLELRRRFPGAEIIAFDNLRRRGSELNLPRLKAAGVRFVHGDVRQPSDLATVPADLIIECSAEPSAQAGYNDDPGYVVETNLFGCYNCLNLARRTKADFIFVSTSRVYSTAALNSLAFRENEERFDWLDEQPVHGVSGLGVCEEFSTCGARSIYGTTKLAAELMVEEFAHAYNFHYLINRCGLIAGPWQMGKVDQGVVSLWVAAHYFGRPLRYIGFGGQGKQVRDILHVDDVADLVATQAGAMSSYDRLTLNVGGGLSFSLSLREMTAECEQLTGKRIEIGSECADRPADLRIYVTDNRRIGGLCGWKPTRNPRQVLQDLFCWIRNNEQLVASSLFARAS
jgi:CDP-paratose 2-epimerase